MSSSSTSKTDIFDKVDEAVLLASARFVEYEWDARSFCFDKSEPAESILLKLIHLLPALRAPLDGTSFLRLMEGPKLILIKESIKRLVRQKRLAGYSSSVVVFTRGLGGEGTRVRQKARRYRPLGPLEVLARL
jgi:hypothetical protein